MHRVAQFLQVGIKLLFLSTLGLSGLVLRSILKTPQPLETVLSGESRLYKWTQGHVFYKVFGSVEAPPLLLVHAPAIGASSYEMRHVFDELGRYYRVYALDLLGFGLSDHPNIAYSAQTYISLLQDFLKRVVAQPATILASGLSANYAIALASETPELCSHLALLAPSSLFTRKVQRDWLSRLIHEPMGSVICYSLLTPRVVLHLLLAWQRGVSPAQICDEDLDYYYAAAHQLGARYAALAHLAGELELDVAPVFEEQAQSTLVIWGVQALPNVRSISSQHGISPSTRVVFIREAGLAVLEEQPEKVVANILCWLKDEQRSDAVSPGDESSAQQETSEQPETPASSLLTVPPEAAPSQVGDDLIELATEMNGVVDKEESREVAPLPEPLAPPAVEAYCVKCKQKRTMLDPRPITTKNNRRAMGGTCPVCSTKLFRFIAG